MQDIEVMVAVYKAHATTQGQHRKPLMRAF